MLSVYGDLRRPGRVLDYGCGNGALTYWLYRSGFGSDVVGIDISRTGVEMANRRFGGAGMRFESFGPGASLEHLGRFDVIVCSHVLEHLSAPRDALEQMKPLSDLFLFEVPLEDCLSMNAKAALKRTSRTELSDQHLQFWNRRTFEQFIDGGGLKLLRGRIYAAGSDYGDPPFLQRALQKTVLGVSMSLYGRLFGTRYTALLWNDPLARKS
jgi:hypothetical protein